MELFVMPKMKTKKSAAKRFVVRPGGTVKRGQAFKRHILTKKTTKNKRHLRGATAVHESDVKSVRAILPFAYPSTATHRRETCLESNGGLQHVPATRRSSSLRR